MLTVRDLMSAQLDMISPEASLREAVVLMNKADNRQLPVVEEGNLIGIISNRDIRLAVNSPLLSDETISRMKVLEEHTVSECMSRNPRCIDVDASIQEAADLLALHKIGALPVMKDDTLVGIITVTDLLKMVAAQPL